MLGEYELLAPKQLLSVPDCQIFQKFSKAILFLREKYQKGDRFVLKVADRKQATFLLAQTWKGSGEAVRPV